jgi:hypothetical protein
MPSGHLPVGPQPDSRGFASVMASWCSRQEDADAEPENVAIVQPTPAGFGLGGCHTTGARHSGGVIALSTIPDRGSDAPALYTLYTRELYTRVDWFIHKRL